jgi:transposase
MESTGSYWIPVFNLLEGHVTVVLANPEEVKNRKGHKTDRKDAGHLADLLRHNQVKSSYIAEPVRQLRDLTRRRVQLTQDATRERNRVQKLLQQVRRARKNPGLRISEADGGGAASGGNGDRNGD